MHDARSLAGRMAELRARYPNGEPDMITDVVLAVLGSMTGDISLRETALLYEIGALGEAVAIARQEIAALKVDDITASYIPCATDELDAIVAHTAAADRPHRGQVRPGTGRTAGCRRGFRAGESSERSAASCECDGSVGHRQAAGKLRLGRRCFVISPVRSLRRVS